jgi:hypothetical protein
MQLMDLQAWYFWFTTGEMHGTEVKVDVRRRCRDLSWQIADKIRAADDVDYLEETLDVLLSPRFSTARERYDAMSAVLNKLGQRVNPRYQKRIREISDANLKAGGWLNSNAPGAYRLD